jgi:hypothetical protein
MLDHVVERNRHTLLRNDYPQRPFIPYSGFENGLYAVNSCDEGRVDGTSAWTRGGQKVATSRVMTD